MVQHLLLLQPLVKRGAVKCRRGRLAEPKSAGEEAAKRRRDGAQTVAVTQAPDLDVLTVVLSRTDTVLRATNITWHFIAEILLHRPASVCLRSIACLLVCYPVLRVSLL